MALVKVDCSAFTANDLAYYKVVITDTTVTSYSVVAFHTATYPSTNVYDEFDAKVHRSLNLITGRVPADNLLKDIKIKLSGEDRNGFHYQVADRLPLLKNVFHNRDFPVDHPSDIKIESVNSGSLGVSNGQILGYFDDELDRKMIDDRVKMKTDYRRLSSSRVPQADMSNFDSHDVPVVDIEDLVSAYRSRLTNLKSKSTSNSSTPVIIEGQVDMIEGTSSFDLKQEIKEPGSSSTLSRLASYLAPQSVLHGSSVPVQGKKP